MYVPKLFREQRQRHVERLVKEYGFGLLVTTAADRPYATHVPFLYEPNRLLCHLARVNPQVQQLEDTGVALAIFTGPHTYVSPSWYESHGVPTWNYAVVHIYGRPKPIVGQTELKRLVERMADYYEQGEAKPWNPTYDASMLRGIAGFEIEITEILGNFKLSQNRPMADRLNVIERLRSRGSDNSRHTADLMEEIALGAPNPDG